MSTHTLTITQDLSDQLNEAFGKGKWVQALREGLKSGLHPALPPKGKSVTRGIRIDTPTKALLDKAFKSSGETSFPTYLVNCLYGALCVLTKSPDKEVATKSSCDTPDPLTFLDLPSHTSRKEQKTLTENAHKTLLRGRVGICEAATGVGKGLSIAALANAHSANDLVVVAAPTHLILKQIVEDFERIEKAYDAPYFVQLLGRGEFVSQTRLLRILEEAPKTPGCAEAQEWLDNHAQKDRWRMESLSMAAPAFPSYMVRLTGGKMEDMGEKQYQQQFEGIEKAKVIFCTHAMLIIDAKIRRYRAMSEAKEDHGDLLFEISVEERNALLASRDVQSILPDYSTLLVDEAHLLEQNAASILSERFSLRWLKGALYHSQTEKNRNHMKTVLKGMVDLAPEDSSEMYAMNNHGSGYASKTAITLLNILNGVLNDVRIGSKKIADEDRGRILSAKNALSRWLSPRNANILRVDFSPVKSYPSINIGPHSVGPILDMIWQIPKATCLFSATLYTPTGVSGYSSRYISSVLRLPLGRVDEHPPLIPAWVTNPVTLHMPKPRKPEHIVLTPPKGSSEMETQEVYDWHSALCRQIKDIINNAKGGTLLLSPGFKSAEVLYEMMEVEYGDRLILMNSNNFHSNRERYMAMAMAGKRPVWLAVGRAWTGLSLSASHEVPPEKDEVLTDLIMIRIPYGVNRTLTHRKAATSGNGFQQELLDTLMRVRQGIGRLVRREGLKNRHLWILDYRMVDPTRKERATYARILSRYRKRKELSAL